VSVTEYRPGGWTPSRPRHRVSWLEQILQDSGFPQQSNVEKEQRYGPGWRVATHW